MSNKTLYEVLEVGSDAAPECIRAAFLQLSSRLDAESAADPDAADAPMRRLSVKEAYRILSNSERRRKYDEELRMRELQALAFSSDPPQAFHPAVVLMLLALVGGLYFYFEKVEQAEGIRLAEESAAERRAADVAEAARAERERIEKQAPFGGAAQLAPLDSNTLPASPSGNMPLPAFR